MKIAAKEAKNQLGKLGQLAHEGQRITVTRNGEPWFDLVPHQKATRNIEPLKELKPVLSAREAVAPIAKEDLPGWM